MSGLPAISTTSLPADIRAAVEIELIEVIA